MYSGLKNVFFFCVFQQRTMRKKGLKCLTNLFSSTCGYLVELDTVKCTLRMSFLVSRVKKLYFLNQEPPSAQEFIMKLSLCVWNADTDGQNRMEAAWPCNIESWHIFSFHDCVGPVWLAWESSVDDSLRSDATNKIEILPMLLSLDEF